MKLSSVSIKDIARKLGIAPSTVSRALNGQYGVNPKTREQVILVAEEMGYVPNMGARALVQRKSRLVGIVLPEIDLAERLPLFELFPPINRTLKLHTKDTMVHFIDLAAYQRGDLEQLCRLRDLEGLIIMTRFETDHPLLQDARTLDTPTVLLQEDIVGKSCSSIITDDYEGMRLSVEHVRSFGHTQIGLVNGPAHVTGSKQKLAGFQAAMNAVGLEVDESAIIHSDMSGYGGAVSTGELLERCPQLTAILYANDLMALGGMSRLQQNGMSVPNGISIIGYDDRVYAHLLNPPLTTIRHNANFGVRAAELLIMLLNGDRGRVERLRPELMTRGSVAPPPYFASSGIR